ncbi:tail fiber domain-containing protein [Fibrella aquatica]|uniref:tail fiber domain-containing protein n=1 Tax=Fibrella aquatica TaxID=3242487 RepID=UPI00351FC10F
MIRKLLLTTGLLYFHGIAIAQDPSTDRWIDSSDETRITLPTSETGRVVITKGNPGSGGFNEFLRIQPTHSTHEYIGFRNGTTTNSFVPVLLSYSESNAGSAMVLAGVTNPTYDLINNSPMLLFDTRTHGDNTLSTGGGAITYRPLFAWRNYTTVHMQMLANGNLGLGTTSPGAQLHTTGSVRFAGLPISSSTSVVMADGNGTLSRHVLPASSTLATISSSATNTLPKFGNSGTLSGSQITDNGAGVGIGGVPTAGAKLTLYGTISLMSDERQKTNIVRLDHASDKVSALNGYYYNWREGSDSKQVGFMAQEVERVLPEVVSQNSEGTRFVNYDGLVPLLTEAIKEQRAMLDAQSQLIKELQREVSSLKRKK